MSPAPPGFRGAPGAVHPHAMVHPTPSPILIAAAGPDCGRALARIDDHGPARVIGRSRRTDIHVDDPDLEPHHLLLGPAGETVALTGIVARTAAGSTAVGRSVLTTIPSPAAGDPDPVTVIRRPRPIPPVEPVTPTLDPADAARPDRVVPSTSGIGPSGPIAAVTGVIAAGTIAAITGNAMFVLFAAVGVVTSLSVTGVELVRLRRARRHRRAADMERRDRTAAAVAAAAAVVAGADRDRWPLDLVARAAGRRVWERRLGHHDATRVVVGIADRPAPIDLTGIVAADLPAGPPTLLERPVTIDLGPGTVCVVTARDTRGRSVADGLVRSLMGQLRVHLGPADLTIERGHLSGSAHDPAPHRVIVLDDPRTLADVEAPIRRLLASEHPPAVIAVAAAGATVPSVATVIIEADHCGAARVHQDPVGGDPPIDVTLARITEDTLAAVERALAGRRDPERPLSLATDLPTSVDLGPLLTADRPPGPSGDRSRVRVTLGEGPAGVVGVDLVADGPHVLVAGTTGSGKSELLVTLALSVTAHHPPDDVQFLLIDHKGGAGLGHLACLPHVVGLVTDLDGERLDRTIIGLEAEIRHRESVLARLGVRDLGDVDHRAVGTDDGRAVPARLVVIVDEVAALLEGRRDAAVVLTDIARRGRSLGMHLVLATQRPAGVIPEALAANIDIRVALRVRDSADSVDVLGDPMAARIPREVPGRAVLRIGGDIPVPVQTARSTDDDIAAVRRRWVERPVIDLPWHPPLPDELDVGPGCPPDEHGLIDRPEHRERPPLTWAPGDGSLALVGAVGSGTTQALITVTARLCDAQVYVLDARGDRRLDDLARRPHVAPVVRIGDTERVGRLVERLRVEIAARRRVGGADSLGRVVLAIDGLEEVRRTADDLPGRVADSLDRVLAEGPAVGIVTVATAAGSPPSRLQMTEWTFTGRPGRIRLTGPDGVVTTAQVALVSRDDGPADGCHAPAPTPIGVLPETVDPTVVGGRRTEAGVALTIGIGADSLDPGGIVVPDGDHVLVLGPDRSGRSAVLDVLVAAWGDAQAGATARITRVTGGTSDVPVVDGPHLVVIDDAARVDDPSGEFAARLEAGEPGLTVFATAHADALRARFGHWTQVVRRSRLGIVLSSAADGDGDLLGASLPGRPAMAPRPGLVWLVAEGSVEQLQVAAPTPVARRLR